MIDNKYYVEKVVGAGGSSKVFLATDSQNNKVAIKAIRKDKEYKKQTATNMLRREFESLQQFSDHPNVVNAIDCNYEGEAIFKGKTEEIMYNVLEYAENGTLGRFIRYTGGLEEEIARLYIVQILDAINFIHKQDYIHLDIKLENILLDGFYNIKVADLGSCTNVGLSNGKTHVRRGTTNYMAPEVASLKSRKKFDGKAADIYSLGVSFYLMLTGEFPTANDFENCDMKGPNSSNTCESDKEDSLDAEMKDEDSSPSKFATLSEEVRILLQCMLNPDPSKRPNISEICQYSWITSSFSQDILHEVYSEMEYRKKYIQKYNKSKRN